MSFEEVRAYAISVLSLVQEVMRLRAQGNYAQDLMQDLVDKVQHVAETGLYVSLQAQSVSDRSLHVIRNLQQVSFTLSELVAPESPTRSRRDVVQARLLIDSYTREYDRGVGHTVAYPKEVQVDFYLVGDSELKAFREGRYEVVQVALQNSFQEMKSTSTEMVTLFRKVLKALPMIIERVDVNEVDFGGLQEASQEIPWSIP